MDREKIIQLINDFEAGSGVFLVEAKLTPSKLTVFIDKEDGIGIEECSRLHRWLYQQLDPAGFNDTHEIEVSSPGLDQPLKVFQQFIKGIGKRVHVVLPDGRRMDGKINQADQDGFQLQHESIEKLNVEKKREALSRFSYPEVKEVKLEY